MTETSADQSPSQTQTKPEAIGFEYIIETEGEEFASRIYFVCLLCDSIAEEHSTLDSHLSSMNHQLKFLVNKPAGNL